MKIFSENTIPALVSWCIAFNGEIYHKGGCIGYEYEMYLKQCLDFIFSMTPKQFKEEVQKLDNCEKEILFELFDKLSIYFPDYPISTYSIYLL